MTDAMGAVAAVAADVARLYGMNGVPASPTYPYGSYSATLGRGDSYTLDSREGLRWGRVVVQTFGRTPTAALAKAEEVRAALVGVRLAITGYECTPLRAELDPTMTRDPDDSGVIGVTTTYAFVATPQIAEET